MSSRIARSRVIAEVAVHGLATFAGLAVAFAPVPARAEEALSDPTRPPAAALVPPAVADASGPERADITLQAIVQAAGRRVAVVNGTRVEVGERVAGARVLAIGSNHVRLQRADETIDLVLVSPAFERAREGATR